MNNLPVKAVYLDDNHAICFINYQGEVAGINEYHRRPDGVWCAGWVSFKGSAWDREFTDLPGWNVVSREPLTLTPSIACRRCGSHGFITDGKWVPA